MRHRNYESLIVLSIYDEITPEEKSALQKHIESCSRCSEYSNKLMRFFRERRLGSAAITEQFIDKARNDLRRALAEEAGEAARRHAVIKFRRQNGWLAAGVPAYSLGVVALVMFLAGAVAGYLFLNGSYGENGRMGAVASQISGRTSDDVAIADVRFLSTDDRSGRVKFSFDLIRRYEMDGSLDDKNVQKILAFALVNSDNPGVRLRTIGMLDASVKPDREIEDALVRALKTDDNAGVRREALLSLNRFPFNDRIREALLYVLQNDKNPGMRVAAINSLAGKELNLDSGTGPGKRIDPKVLNVLKDRSASDQNKYVRLKAADMLKELKEL